MSDEYDVGIDPNSVDPFTSSPTNYQIFGQINPDPYDIGIDPDSIDAFTNSPTNAAILEQISTQPTDIVSTISNAISRGLGGAVTALKNKFVDPKTGDTNWKSVAAALGGIYGLYSANRPQEKTGYQGKVPKYEAIREAVPGAQYDPTRRPGSGGQRYFSSTTFAATPAEATAAREARKTEAAGLATLNRENPARVSRSVPTEKAIREGQESYQVREMRPASDVIRDKPVPKYAYGGITELASGGQGRYLGGATDGMADKIPARIDGNQEARLSHGEFVIPADVVSHLGNGNSEAGATRLYSMMDRLRKARTGTTKQGKQINPDKFLPV